MNFLDEILLDLEGPALDGSFDLSDEEIEDLKGAAEAEMERLNSTDALMSVLRIAVLGLEVLANRNKK